MKILLSPAKTQDFSKKSTTLNFSQALYRKQAEQIVNKMRSLSREDVQKLMKVSEDIALRTIEDFSQWGRSGNSKSQALYCYSGEVFKCLNAVTLSDQALANATHSLIILSGVYGIVRATDCIEPYRLEVKTPISIDDHKNLYHFWKEYMDLYFSKNIDVDEVIINIASGEYARMVPWKKLKNRVITPQFKVMKDGTLKTSAVWAKKARGYFTRFLLESNCQTIEEMTAFNAVGFILDSYNEKDILFVKQL